MGADGFAAIVYIDSINFGTGRVGSSPYESASLEMSGTIRRANELGLKSLAGLSTYAGVHFTMVGEDTFVPSELVDTCIGDLSLLQSKGTQLSVLEHHVRAVVRASITKEHFERLVLLHCYPILIEPVFYREQGATQKKVVNTKLDGHVSYIQRIHFSPVLPDRGPCDA